MTSQDRVTRWAIVKLYRDALSSQAEAEAENDSIDAAYHEGRALALFDVLTCITKENH